MLQPNTKLLSGICKRSLKKKTIWIQSHIRLNFLKTPFLFHHRLGYANQTKSYQNYTKLHSSPNIFFDHNTTSHLHTERTYKRLRISLNQKVERSVPPLKIEYFRIDPCHAYRLWIVWMCIAKNRFSIPYKWNAPNNNRHSSYFRVCAEVWPNVFHICQKVRHILCDLHWNLSIHRTNHRFCIVARTQRTNWQFNAYIFDVSRDDWFFFCRSNSSSFENWFCPHVTLCGDQIFLGLKWKIFVFPNGGQRLPPA